MIILKITGFGRSFNRLATTNALREHLSMDSEKIEQIISDAMHGRETFLSFTYKDDAERLATALNKSGITVVFE